MRRLRSLVAMSDLAANLGSARHVWPKQTLLALGAMGMPGSSFQLGGNLYSYADIMIVSDWSLGHLASAEPTALDKPTIAIGLLEAPPCEPAKTDWVHHWPPEFGGLSLALSGKGESFLLRFPGLADFLISNDARQIEAWPAGATSIETLHHLLLDQVLPRVLAQQGRLVLHAGAVRVGDQAIAFIGDSGSGKSTLTASFHASGYSLLCDDGLVLTHRAGVTTALATYPSLRLWPESIASLYSRAPTVAPMAHYSSKRRIILKDIATNGSIPLPIATLYVLAREPGAEGISLRRLSPRAACMEIIGNSFQLDVTDRRRSAEVLANASRIAQHLPVFSVTYPRDFARLPDVHEVILRQLSE